MAAPDPSEESPCPPPGLALCLGTRDLDLLHCLVGVVGDVDIDADGFSMVVDLGGRRNGVGGSQSFR